MKSSCMLVVGVLLVLFSFFYPEKEQSDIKSKDNTTSITITDDTLNIDTSQVQEYSIFTEVKDFCVRNASDIIQFLIFASGVLGILFSMWEDRRIKVAEFIADYNQTFLTYSEFTQVEKLLDSCETIYNKQYGENTITDKTRSEQMLNEFRAVCYEIFVNDTKATTRSKKASADNPNPKPLPPTCDLLSSTKYFCNNQLSNQYQAVIDYLVYLEAFSTLINNRIASIKEVDDLFAYRFFIAVHNPVIQDSDLLKCKEYYQGIWKAYLKWIRYYRRKGKKLPMKELAIDESTVKAEIIK